MKRQSSALSTPENWAPEHDNQTTDAGTKRLAVESGA